MHDDDDDDDAVVIQLSNLYSMMYKSEIIVKKETITLILFFVFWDHSQQSTYTSQQSFIHLDPNHFPSSTMSIYVFWRQPDLIHGQ